MRPAGAVGQAGLASMQHNSHAAHQGKRRVTADQKVDAVRATLDEDEYDSCANELSSEESTSAYGVASTDLRLDAAAELSSGR